eukprot:3661814-Pleurochrysis_carterae.AAC.2
MLASEARNIFALCEASRKADSRISPRPHSTSDAQASEGGHEKGATSRWQAVSHRRARGRLDPLDLSRRARVVLLEREVGRRDGHEEEGEGRRRGADDREGGGDGGERRCVGLQRARQRDVHRVELLGEAVEQPAARRQVEEGERRADDACEERVVQPRAGGEAETKHEA